MPQKRKLKFITGTTAKTINKQIKEARSNTTLYAYKFTHIDGAPFYRRYDCPQSFRYEVGETYVENQYSTNVIRNCGAGINVASLKWCKKDLNYKSPHPYTSSDKTAEASLFIVSFKKSDIVCVPISGKGKFRLKRVTFVKQVTWSKPK